MIDSTLPIERIVVTVSAAVQIGTDEWKQVRTSRVFSVNRPVAGMLSWARSIGLTKATISDLTFSEYTGESM